MRLTSACPAFTCQPPLRAEKLKGGSAEEWSWDNAGQKSRKDLRAQDCSGKQNKVSILFHGFLAGSWSGPFPLDSGRGDIEFAGVFLRL